MALMNDNAVNVLDVEPLAPGRADPETGLLTLGLGGQAASRPQVQEPPFAILNDAGREGEEEDEFEFDDDQELEDEEFDDDEEVDGDLEEFDDDVGEEEEEEEEDF